MAGALRQQAAESARRVLWSLHSLMPQLALPQLAQLVALCFCGKLYGSNRSLRFKGHSGGTRRPWALCIPLMARTNPVSAAHLPQKFRTHDTSTKDFHPNLCSVSS